MFRFIALSLALAVTVIAAPVAGSAEAGSAATCNGAVSWSAAKSYVGRVVTVRGPVVDAVYAQSSNGSPTFLNLGRAYPSPSRFTIVIWSQNRARFGTPERRYRGRTICIRGRVSTYGGVAQIEGVSPTQIAVAS